VDMIRGRILSEVHPELKEDDTPKVTDQKDTEAFVS
jgi:hypothetical protein